MAPPTAIRVITAEEQPDLWDHARSLFDGVWPEYNLHGNHTSKYFASLVPRHARFQVLLYDDAAERVVARGRTIPFTWDGSLGDLPAGIDAVGLRAIDDPRPPSALSALAAEVVLDRQGSGLSRLVLEAMATAARGAGLSALVAPVRPSSKDRYPLIPIDRYAAWKRPDGLPFDPWLRVHARLGATILRAEPRSMQIEGQVAEWEKWTELTLPDDGEYVFPGGLAPLRVRGDVGSYFEPNVWMLHDL